jgi:hypothetical protein
MTRHVYVDETKQRGYLLAAVVIEPVELVAAGKMVRDLILPGQRRLHMKGERDSRKRLIADKIGDSGVRATLYDAGRRHRTDLARRDACLAALVDDLAHAAQIRLVLERDDTLIERDKKQLYDAIRRTNCRERLNYHHDRAATESRLAIPDAIAWCWARGGYWRSRVAGVVDGVREV